MVQKRIAKKLWLMFSNSLVPRSHSVSMTVGDLGTRLVLHYSQKTFNMAAVRSGEDHVQVFF